MPKKKTQKELLEAGLKACGWKEDVSARSTRYKVFTKDGTDVKCLIGKGGAFRRTKTTVSNSRSATDSMEHVAYKKVGLRAESYSSVEQAMADYQSFYGKLYRK